MQAQHILRPGQFIVIEINPGENWPFTIGSVSDDYKTLTCELLMEQPRSITISKGKELLIICSTDSGIYKFPTKVVDTGQDSVVLTLSLLRGTVHLQRREFFRLSRPLVSAKYRQISEPHDILSGELIDAPVKDLSGNGISLIIPMEHELEEGIPVRTEIELTGERRVSLVGQVVRCIPNEPVNGKCLLCINFVLIDERDRDRIVGQLFREQIDRSGKRHGLPRRS